MKKDKQINNKRYIKIALATSFLIAPLTPLLINLDNTSEISTTQHPEYLMLQGWTNSGIYNIEDLSKAPVGSDITDYAVYTIPSQDGTPTGSNTEASITPWYEDNQLVGFVYWHADFDTSNQSMHIDYIDENREDKVFDYSFNTGHHDTLLTEDYVLYGLDTENKQQMEDQDDPTSAITEELFVIDDGQDRIELNVLDILGYSESREEFKTTSEEYGTVMTMTASTDVIHTNSFDIDNQGNLYMSLKFFDAIISINLFGDTGPELNWILSNPITYNFTNVDMGVTPIVPVGTDGVLIEYDNNPEYTPQIKDEWLGKTLDFVDNTGTVLSAGNNTDSTQDISEWSTVDESELFMGQHSVRYLNNWIEEATITPIEDYDPDKVYLSIYDNHVPVYDPYEYSYDEYGMPTIDYQSNSYVKILEVDEENMTYDVIFNQPVLESLLRGNAIFFSNEYSNYLAVNNPTSAWFPSTFQLWSFDYIDTQGNMVNKQLVYDINFESFDENNPADAYRAIPIPQDISNYVYGWNAFSYNYYEDPNYTAPEDNQGLSTGTIVGIVTGVTLGTLLIGGVIWYIFKKK